MHILSVKHEQMDYSRLETVLKSTYLGSKYIS